MEEVVACPRVAHLVQHTVLWQPQEVDCFLEAKAYLVVGEAEDPPRRTLLARQRYEQLPDPLEVYLVEQDGVVPREYLSRCEKRSRG